jgi:hypothetical protein
VTKGPETKGPLLSRVASRPVTKGAFRTESLEGEFSPFRLSLGASLRASAKRLHMQTFPCRKGGTPATVSRITSRQLAPVCIRRRNLAKDRRRRRPGKEEEEPLPASAPPPRGRGARHRVGEEATRRRGSPPPPPPLSSRGRRRRPWISVVFRQRRWTSHRSGLLHRGHPRAGRISATGLNLRCWTAREGGCRRWRCCLPADPELRLVLRSSAGIERGRAARAGAVEESERGQGERGESRTGHPWRRQSARGGERESVRYSQEGRERGVVALQHPQECAKWEADCILQRMIQRLLEHL